MAGQRLLNSVIRLQNDAKDVRLHVLVPRAGQVLVARLLIIGIAYQ